MAFKVFLRWNHLQMVPICIVTLESSPVEQYKAIRYETFSWTQLVEEVWSGTHICIMVCCMLSILEMVYIPELKRLFSKIDIPEAASIKFEFMMYSYIFHRLRTFWPSRSSGLQIPSFLSFGHPWRGWWKAKEDQNIWRSKGIPKGWDASCSSRRESCEFPDQFISLSVGATSRSSWRCKVSLRKHEGWRL